MVRYFTDILKENKVPLEELGFTPKLLNANIQEL